MNYAFLDASAIIYLLEGDPEVRQAAQIVLTSLKSSGGEPAIVISALSLLECRVQPMRNGEKARLDLFDNFFADPGLSIVELNRNVIKQATQLRAQHGLRTPDALQAASALELHDNPTFVTGDSDFKKIKNLNVHQIQ